MFSIAEAKVQRMEATKAVAKCEIYPKIFQLPQAWMFLRIRRRN
jgi:hypothetical protein